MFLPFLTGNPNELAIFKQLAKKSHSIGSLNLFKIFAVVLVYGLDEVKKYAEELDKSGEKLKEQQLFEQIILSFNIDPLQSYITSIIKNYVPDENFKKQVTNNSDLLSLSAKHIMLFLMALQFYAKDRNTLKIYTDKNIDSYVALTDLFNDIPGFLKLANNGIPVEFMEESQLKDFIVFNAMFELESPEQGYFLKFYSPSDSGVRDEAQ